MVKKRKSTKKERVHGIDIKSDEDLRFFFLNTNTHSSGTESNGKEIRRHYVNVFVFCLGDLRDPVI